MSEEKEQKFTMLGNSAQDEYRRIIAKDEFGHVLDIGKVKGNHKSEILEDRARRLQKKLEELEILFNTEMGIVKKIVEEIKDLFKR